MGGMDTIKETHFILKAVAMIVNIANIIIWTSRENTLPCYNESETVLFLHAVGGFSVILTALVVLYLIDEKPGEWAHRLFLGTGAILFLVMGLCGIIRTLDGNHGSWNLIMAILCLSDGIILAIDLIKSQFC